MKKLLLILLCVPLLFSCGSNENDNPNAVKFEQVGYYKSDNNFRCFAYTYSKDDEDQIIQHAKKQQNTSGTTTQVYYFNDYNAKNISLCNNFFQAMQLCLDLDWKYEFRIHHSGVENFRKNE